MLAPTNAMTGGKLTADKGLLFCQEVGTKGLQGLDLVTGEEVFATEAELTTKFTGRRLQAAEKRRDTIIIPQAENTYRIYYQGEDIYVWRKMK
ncbi:MAG: hypothetical protein LPK19_03140 [Hymenobacteraceae bacterium]|nr:hypothetical protein [Hymenobacteraceae bacterium]MDX5395186.1 hypothetical protein [Hymenobacteraceae bacterium]MDX5511224.1 hypothetical protein [Hymenobacteraceae bacterium]